MSIVAEVPGFMQVFSDGSVKRFAPELAPASAEPSAGYKSKDVIIDPSKPITARLFLPAAPSTSAAAQLPVIVYFHGGGFAIGSTTWLGYHLFLGDLSAASQAVVFSVDYRLAPENRLPTAYDDGYSAIEWLTRNVMSEPWLERADLSRVFLSGDSAGANLAHQVAVGAVKNKAFPLTIKGLLLIHPYFGSEKRTEREMAGGAAGDVAMNDMFWGLSLPEGSNRDYHGCNFEMVEMSAAEWRQFPPVAVYVAGMDFLKERGVMYAEFVRRKGVKRVEVVEAEGESHVFHVFRPESESTRLLQKQIIGFLNSF
ncbi:hypothetical protein U1Q18_018655 [Sarracenia purpurea var. burkii]